MEEWFKPKRCLTIFLWDGEYWYPDFVVKRIFY